jgi:hypothetical protein
MTTANKPAAKLRLNKASRDVFMGLRRPTHGTHRLQPGFSTMALPTAHLRVLRIHPRPEGGFEIRNEFPKDPPLGLADSFEQAMETSHREAFNESQRGSNVVVEALRDGRWIEIERVMPPDALDVDVSLSEADEQAVTDHLYRCPRCNQLVDQRDLRDCLTHEVPGHERVGRH